jgi:hypothetical protein
MAQEQEADTKAAQPVIESFYQVLLWPLQIVLPDTVHAQKLDPTEWFRRIDAYLRCKGSRWEELKDHYDRGTSEQAVTRYAELVYFHPFVQRFLYSRSGAEPERPLRIYRRSDISQAKVVLKKGGNPVDLDIKRIHLYLLDMEVAVLAMEVFARESLSLQTSEELLDQFRRAYPPYWEENKAGHCPAKVTWLNCNSDIVSESDYCNQECFQAFVKEHLSPPVARHWADLLAPVEVYKPGEQEDHWSLKRRLFFRLIGDERIPYMAYLALRKPEGLTRGDWVRIALAEEWGSSATLPYSTAFLADFERRYCYDPFWGESFCDQGWMNTRYLCCGYAFTVVGSNDSRDSDFYINPVTGLLAHFRHHYFQMGLIIHFQHAALLMISDRLAEAVARFQSDETQRQRFHKDIQAIQESLLRFTHRYWFPEVSNHIQGRELFQFWREHLGTQALYDQVSKEVQETNQYLDAWQQAEQTQTTLRLTEVAIAGLGLGVFAGLLGMNLIRWDEKDATFNIGEYPVNFWSLVLFSIVVTIVLMGLLYWFVRQRPIIRLKRWCKRLADQACEWIVRRGQSR